jgi:hypothetical protein
VIVAEGQTAASFNIDAVAAVGNTTIQATTANSPAFAARKVLGWTVSSVAGSVGTPGGMTASWGVALDSSAPEGGVVVGLTSSNPALVTVPGAVVVPAGETTAAFTATLNNPYAGTARIYATMPGSQQSGPFGWLVTGLSGPGSAAQGSSAQWTVTLNVAAPAGGLVVGLESHDTTGAPVAGGSVPASVTVPEGQTSATFPVTAVADPLSGTSLLIARFNASYVLGYFQYRLAQTIAPTTIPVRGVAKGTLSVSPAAPASGFTIALQSSDPTVATVVPSSVMIPANGSSATFSVTGVGPGQASVMMTAGGWSQKQTIVVTAP